MDLAVRDIVRSRYNNRKGENLYVKMYNVKHGNAKSLVQWKKKYETCTAAI